LKYQVILGLGSNRSFEGNTPLELLALSCIRLGEFIEDIEWSSVYRTEAMYVKAQDDFHNMAVTGVFEGSPRSLLEKIHIVEASFGRDRRREFRNGPRPLDIDIEVFGSEKVDEPDLQIPHPRMGERAFVLVPVLEVLKKNADAHKDSISLYEKKLSVLDGQRVDFALDSQDFGRLVYRLRQGGEKYGRDRKYGGKSGFTET